MVHGCQLYHRATLIAEPQLGVGEDAQERAQGFAVVLAGPADHSAFEFAQVVTVGLDTLLMVVPDVGVGQLGEFLPGETLAGLAG